VRAQLLEEHGIEIMAAFGPLRGRVWRIGAMGTNARLPSVLTVLGGLEAVLCRARATAAARGWRGRRAGRVRNLERGRRLWAVRRAEKANDVLAGLHRVVDHGTGAWMLAILSCNVTSFRLG